MLILRNYYSDYLIALLNRLLSAVEWHVVLHKTVFLRKKQATFIQTKDTHFDLFSCLSEFGRNDLYGVVGHVLQSQSSLHKVVHRECHCLFNFVD